MNRKTFHGAAICLVLLASLSVMSGCSRGYKVTGKLLKNGAPITVSDKGVVQVSLVPVDAGDDGKFIYGTTVNKDGTFVVNGRADGSGIVAGKYRVGVQIYDPYPGNDVLKGKFQATKSPIVKEIKGDGQITVDIEKDAGG